MASIYDDPALLNARSEAQQATQGVADMQTGGASLADTLRKTLTEKFSQDNPLYANRESALTNYLNTTTQAPLDYTAKSAGGNSDVIYNPLQQANLIQSRRSSAMAPLTTANSLLALGTGGLNDVISNTLNSYQAMVEAAKTGAQAKRLNYTDLLTELSHRADEAYKNASLAKKQQPTASQQYKKQELANSILAGLQNIQRAKDALGKTPSGVKYSGSSIRTKLPTWLGGYGDDVNALNAALAGYNTSLFDIAGKAFTGKERQLLEALVGDITKEPSANIASLNQAEQTLLQKLDLLQTDTNDYESSGGWEIVP